MAAEIDWHIAVSTDRNSITTVYAMESNRPVVVTTERMLLAGGVWLPTDLARQMIIALDLAAANQRAA